MRTGVVRGARKSDEVDKRGRVHTASGENASESLSTSLKTESSEMSESIVRDPTPWLGSANREGSRAGCCG